MSTLFGISGLSIRNYPLKYFISKDQYSRNIRPGHLNHRLRFQGFSMLKALFPLVLRIARIGDFYDLPTSGILTTSVNTPSQTSQTVCDFYDVIGRIGSISTLKVHPRQSPTSAIFRMSVNMKFACLGWSPTIGDFYDECEHEVCLSGTSRILSLLATKA